MPNAAPKPTPVSKKTTFGLTRTTSSKFKIRFNFLIKSKAIKFFLRNSKKSRKEKPISKPGTTERLAGVSQARPNAKGSSFRAN